MIMVYQLSQRDTNDKRLSLVTSDRNESATKPFIKHKCDTDFIPFRDPLIFACSAPKKGEQQRESNLEMGKRTKMNFTRFRSLSPCTTVQRTYRVSLFPLSRSPLLRFKSFLRLLAGEHQTARDGFFSLSLSLFRLVFPWQTLTNRMMDSLSLANVPFR